MSDTATLGLPDAARRLGVPVRILRRAIRAGKLPALPQLTATASLSAEWLASAEAAVEASPKLFSSIARQKVAAFARYKGTSAWRKYANRVREHAHFQAAMDKADQAPGTSANP
jgi:hypothetical protein